jgi:2-(1,2-epoxy-1,2-dihydrophenyl)acetyl-CoA isomerase
MHDKVLLDVRDRVATLAINRPDKLNAIDGDVALALQESLRRVATDSDVRALVVTGVGRVFSAGGDVKVMEAAAQSPNQEAFFDEPLRDIHRAAVLLRELPKPTLAVIRGFATGAGMNLALCCDLRIAATTARMNQAFVHLGLVPDTGGTHTLPRLVGAAKAAELMFLGDFVDGGEAERLGLVNRAVPEERLDAEAAEWARRLAAAPTLALAAIKALLRETYRRSFEEQTEAERLAQLEVGRSADFREGVRAFFEKRQPRFAGR